MLTALKLVAVLSALGRCSDAEPTLFGMVIDFEGCPRCQEELCPKSGEDCRHGLVHDPCGCCPGGACLLLEREKCFNPDYGLKLSESGLRRYGFCGEHMDCVSRTDLGGNESPESLCVCKETEPICGSDNATYGSICEVSGSQVRILHYGPCVTRPLIVSAPHSAYSYEGGNFALDCEAKGFPVPNIVWEFQSFTGTRIVLPGDDPTVVVHSRGGPENYMLTSWLQIETLRRNDSGTYICVARNTEGEDRAMTTIQVSVYGL